MPFNRRGESITYTKKKKEADKQLKLQIEIRGIWNVKTKVS